MQAAQSFGDLDCLPTFHLTALIKLARKNVPEEAIAEAIDVAKSGETVTTKRAVSIIEKHGPRPMPQGRKPKTQPNPEPAPAANPLDALQASLDAFTANLETMTATLPQKDRDALADRFLHLAVKLREQPQPAASKPSRRTSTRGRKRSAA